MGLDLDLAFSISATSRPPRGKEVDGREYHFLSPDAFREKIALGSFVEWEEVYKDQYYGTLRSELDRIWKEDRHAVFDIDVQGGMNLKKQFGDQACSIFIEPPSLEELEKRLRGRGTDDEAQLLKRLGKAEEEMDHASFFDHIVVNDDLQAALAETEAIIREFLSN